MESLDGLYSTAMSFLNAFFGLICEGLPAEICKQCGEKYFDAKVSAKIDEFIKKYQKEKPLRYIPVPVFSGDLVLK